MKTIPFKELCAQYGTKSNGFVEVTDREAALSDIRSTGSACWGAGNNIGNTGWIQLASPSPQHRGDMATVFVCKAALIA